RLDGRAPSAGGPAHLRGGPIMPRLRLWMAAAWAGLGAWVWLSPAPATAADEAPSPASATALKFVQGLRERGYFELALEYLEGLRNAPATPPDLKTIIDYEMGRSLLDEAAHTADLERRKEMFDQARGRLDAFAKANPKHALAPEALVQLARLLVE